MIKLLKVAIPLVESNVTVFDADVNVPFDSHFDNEYKEMEADH